MKKIIQVVMFLCLAGYVHATMVSGQAGYILVINADGSVNAVISGTSSVIASSNTFHGTFYQGDGEDWKVNFDSTTGQVGIYFTGMLPAGTNSIGEVTGDSDTFKVGAEVMNFPADYPDAGLATALSSSDTNKNESFQGGTWKSTVTYEFHAGSHTAGVLYASGNIPSTAFDVIAWDFLSVGGISTVTGLGGTIYCPAGRGKNSGILPVEFISPIIAVFLSVGDTFYYDIYGKP